MSASTARSLRSSNGCLTCRTRHKKCPGPQSGTGDCYECCRLNVECLGYHQQRFFWMRDSRTLKHFTDDIKKWTSKRANLQLPRRLTFEHYLNLPRDPPSPSAGQFAPSPNCSSAPYQPYPSNQPPNNVLHPPPPYENNLFNITYGSESQSGEAVSGLQYWKYLNGGDDIVQEGTKLH